MISILKFRNRFWVYCLFLLSFDSFSQVIITPDNQGIGTSIPYSSSRLTLDGKDQTNEVLSLKSNSSPNIYFYTPLVSSFANRAAYMGVNITEEGSFFDVGSYPNSNLGFSLISNGNRKIYIKPNGNIGLGFSPLFPNAPVHIFSPEFTSEALRLETTDAATNPVMTFYRQSTKLGQIGATTGTSPDLEIKSNVAGINFSTSGIAMKIGTNGNIGMPTVAPFRKLNITGRVNIDAGSLEFDSYGGNAGDILYSGGAGSPTWAAPPFIAKYAVSAKTSSGIILNYSPVNEQDLILNTENFDDGNIFNAATFTAAHSGVYEVYLEFSLVSVSPNNKAIELSIYRNGALPAVHNQIYTNHIHGWVNNVNASVFGAVGIYSVQYKELFKVNAGETLLFRVRNPDYEPITIYPKLLIKAIY